MKKSFLLLLPLLLLLLPFFIPHTALALEMNEVASEKVTPDMSFQYNIKRLKEKVTLKLYSFSPVKKSAYYKKLLRRRLSELKYIVDNDNTAYIQTASQRYSATAGQYTDYINKKNLNSEGKEARELFSSQIPILEKLRDTYEGTRAQWRFLQYDIDYLNTYSSTLPN